MTISFASKSILLVDCQATQQDPQTGQLLEIAWLPNKTNQRIESALVKPAGNFVLSPKIQALTGLQRWLCTETPRTTRKKSFRISRAQRNMLPRTPGVYYFRNAEKQILYKRDHQFSQTSSHFRIETQTTQACDPARRQAVG